MPDIDPTLRILYPADDGVGVCIVTPNPDCGLTIDEVAAKDVPAGRPFRIVSVDTLPTDRTFRAAWEYQP